jgi:hypothetical protein
LREYFDNRIVFRWIWVKYLIKKRWQKIKISIL